MYPFSLFLTENLTFRINKLTMLICFYSSQDTQIAVYYQPLVTTLHLKSKSRYILKVKNVVILEKISGLTNCYK